MGKIKYLIDEKKVKQKEILCISFTNETVNNLKNKLMSIGYKIDVMTFHKLGLSILNNKELKIVNDYYLDFIIDEYFKSFIKYDKKRVKILKELLYTNKSIDDILKSQEYERIKMTIKTFIKLAKSNDIKIVDIYNIYKRSLFNERSLLKNICDVYLIYKRELESSSSYDFDDLIIKAKDNVKYQKLKYKYIIIDEFQDTSKVRLNLIKEIIKYTDASLFAVGDDWQSIYRFSGCNLDQFINFNKYFCNASYFYLNHTYRNSMELIYVSSKFVMKNKHQLKKKIISNKSIHKPIKILFNYKFDEVINLIQNKNIMVLGRNNLDIKDIDWPNKLTIHRSKGLEEDNIIIVNSESIPSKIQNERILRHVLQSKDYILHEEERRLFYVALTRARDYVYIMVNKKSPFIKEIMHDYKDYIEVLKK